MIKNKSFQLGITGLFRLVSYFSRACVRVRMWLGPAVLELDSINRLNSPFLCECLIFSEKKLFSIKIVLYEKKFSFNVLQKEFNVIQCGFNVLRCGFNVIQYLVSNKMRRIFASESPNGLAC